MWFSFDFVRAVARDLALGLSLGLALDFADGRLVDEFSELVFAGFEGFLVEMGGWEFGGGIGDFISVEGDGAGFDEFAGFAVGLGESEGGEEGGEGDEAVFVEDLGWDLSFGGVDGLLAFGEGFDEVGFGGLGGFWGVVEGDDLFCEADFGVAGVGAGGEEGFGFGDWDVGAEFEPVEDEVVGDGHGFAEHVVGFVDDADVVAEGLGHFFFSVGADEEGAEHDGLRALAVLLHEVAPDEVVEFLVVSAEFDVGVDFYGVESLAEGVEELVHGDGLVGFPPFGEVVALHDAGDGGSAAEADDVFEGHFAEPVFVVIDLSFVGVEDFIDLVGDGVDVGLDFFSGELFTGFGFAAWVADHGREVSDDEAGGVAEFLEVAEFSEDDGPPEGDVGGGGVDAEFGAEGFTGGEFFAEVFFADDFGRTSAEEFELLVYGHGYGGGGYLRVGGWGSEACLVLAA